MTDTILEAFYKAPESLKQALGDRWCGPDRFPHSGDTLVATYEGERSVRLYAAAMPVLFYIIRYTDDDGTEVELGTGAGPTMQAFAINLAEALSEGMLGVEIHQKDTARFPETEGDIRNLMGWLNTLQEEDDIAISEGGLTIVAKSGAYYELGGVPEEELDQWPDEAKH